MQNAGGRAKMDRVGNVDSVDGLEVSVEEATPGWDAYAVWRDRVHGERERAQSSTPRAATVRSAQQEATATGWDPLETWQGRVRGARANSRR